MENSRENNTGLWASFVAASSETNFKDIKTNSDLFNKMALAACFKQCARTDVDVVFMPELEQTYKCMITYKQSLRLIKELDQQ